MGRTLPSAPASDNSIPDSSRRFAVLRPTSQLRGSTVRSIVSRVRHNLLSAGIAAAVALVLVCPAHALRFQQRPDWMFGIGYGYGTAQFQNGNDTESEYRGGATPQVRFGRMLSPHWMVSVNWEQWLTELGEDEVKFRRSLQNLGLGIAYFPGDPSGPVYGLFFRAGAGMGWAGTGAKHAIEGEAQHKGERLDEWGVGAFGEAGYEFWIARNFTAGLMANYSWFDIQETVVERAQFATITVLMNAYF